MALIKISTFLAVCAASLLIATQLPSSEAGGDGHANGKHGGGGGIFKRCMNISITETSQLTAANATCRTQLNLNAAPVEGEHNTNWRCMANCMLTQLGMITAENTLSTSGVSSFVDATFPEAARANLKTGIDACSTTPADTVTDAAANPCGQTASLEKCIMKAIHQVCMPQRAPRT